MNGLLLLLLAGGAWWLYSRGRDGSANVPDQASLVDPNPANDWAYDNGLPLEPSVLPETPAASAVPANDVERNRAAFLAAIRQLESRGRYDVMYGFRPFTDFSVHPNQWFPINLPGYEGIGSTAAGAYQLLYKTWNTLRKRLNLPDFSPASQDLAALDLLREIGALPYVDAGDFPNALRIASSQWASLPGSTANQNPVALATALDAIHANMA